jgi:hypothetical protein
MRTHNLLLSAGLTFLVAACSQSTADTANPDNSAAASNQSTPAAEPQADPAQLQANDADLQSLKNLAAELESTVASVIAPIDAADKAHTELVTMAQESKISDKKVAAMVSKTVSKGEIFVDRKVPKDKKADFEARLTTLKEAAGTLPQSMQDVSAAHQKVAELQGKAQTLFTNIEGRSNAMTSGTGAMFPEAQADVDEAARLKADIDAKAQAANTTLDEATTRAKALTEKLGGQAGSGKGEADAGKGEEAADKGKSPKPAKGAKSAKGAEDAKPEKAAAEPK